MKRKRRGIGIVLEMALMACLSIAIAHAISGMQIHQTFNVVLADHDEPSLNFLHSLSHTTYNTLYHKDVDGDTDKECGIFPLYDMMYYYVAQEKDSKTELNICDPFDQVDDDSDEAKEVEIILYDIVKEHYALFVNEYGGMDKYLVLTSSEGKTLMCLSLAGSEREWNEETQQWEDSGEVTENTEVCIAGEQIRESGEEEGKPIEITKSTSIPIPGARGIATLTLVKFRWLSSVL